MPQPVAKGLFLVCPKTGKLIGFNSRSRLLRWLFPAAGLLALLWYLIRVLPKPSRATYPCQRVAAPLASGFVSYVFGAGVLALAWRNARRNLRRARFVLAAVCLATAGVGLVLTLRPEHVHGRSVSFAEGPNAPVGIGRGIFPGRVVWAYSPTAAHWDGYTGFWWDDTNTSQADAATMFSQSLRSLTGAATDAAAWDALFRYFNLAHGRTNTGYQAGEKIAVKINLNNCFDQTEADNALNTSPQMVLALLRQLVNTAGVPQPNITVYDAVRWFPDFMFNKCHAEFPDVVYLDKSGGNGRAQVQWAVDAITYTVPNDCSTALATCAIDATYIINMAAFKGHNQAGVSLTAKNHYGSLYQIAPMNNRDHSFIGTTGPCYSPLVDLMGHQHLGAKTVLFLIDGLYASQQQFFGQPVPFQLPPFNGGWSSSLFMSQDPVAIDSVGLDFLNSESFLPDTSTWTPDGYLREAAMASNAPSSWPWGGYPYANLPWPSFGVHEHWNNATQRQYSRNLGGTNGIELIALAPPPAAVPRQFNMDGVVDSTGYKIGTNAAGTAALFAAVNGTALYVAAPTPGYVTTPATTGEDHFIFVTDTLAPLGPAPWQKIGQAAFSLGKPFLAEDGWSKTPSWTNTTAAARCATAATTAGYMEGTIDLVETFGYLPPVVYIAYAAYVWDNPSHGALIPASQIPASVNNDGNIDSNEFLVVPTAAIRDTGLTGSFDCVDPTRTFIPSLTPSAAGDIITWPTVPAHLYQVFTTADLSQPFAPCSSIFVAAPGQFTLSYTNSTPAAARFYRLTHQSP